MSAEFSLKISKKIENDSSKNDSSKNYAKHKNTVLNMNGL
jgi:hypothetical protein